MITIGSAECQLAHVYLMRGACHDSCLYGEERACTLQTLLEGILQHFRMLSADDIADVYIQELTEGVGKTGIKPGLIKTATGMKFTPGVWPTLRKSSNSCTSRSIYCRPKSSRPMAP